MNRVVIAKYAPIIGCHDVLHLDVGCKVCAQGQIVAKGCLILRVGESASSVLLLAIEWILYLPEPPQAIELTVTQTISMSWLDHRYVPR